MQAWSLVGEARSHVLRSNDPARWPQQREPASCNRAPTQPNKNLRSAAAPPFPPDSFLLSHGPRLSGLQQERGPSLRTYGVGTPALREDKPRLPVSPPFSFPQPQASCVKGRGSRFPAAEWTRCSRKHLADSFWGSWLCTSTSCTEVTHVYWTSAPYQALGEGTVSLVDRAGFTGKEGWREGSEPWRRAWPQRDAQSGRRSRRRVHTSGQPSGHTNSTTVYNRDGWGGGPHAGKGRVRCGWEGHQIRKKWSRNLQEFLLKTELMRDQAEQTAIAPNPPFSRVRTAGPDAAGADLPHEEWDRRRPPWRPWEDHCWKHSGTGSPARRGRCEVQERVRDGGGEGRRRQARPSICGRMTSDLPSSNTVSLECSGQGGREASGVRLHQVWSYPRRELRPGWGHAVLGCLNWLITQDCFPLLLNES